MSAYTVKIEDKDRPLVRNIFIDDKQRSLAGYNP